MYDDRTPGASKRELTDPGEDDDAQRPIDWYAVREGGEPVAYFLRREEAERFCKNGG